MKIQVTAWQLSLFFFRQHVSSIIRSSRGTPKQTFSRFTGVKLLLSCVWLFRNNVGLRIRGEMWNIKKSIKRNKERSFPRSRSCSLTAVLLPWQHSLHKIATFSTTAFVCKKRGKKNPHQIWCVCLCVCWQSSGSFPLLPVTGASWCQLAWHFPASLSGSAKV